MSTARPSLRVTRLAYALLAVAFASVFLFAIERSLRLEEELDGEVRQRAQDELHRVLALWERMQLDRIRTAIRDLADAPLQPAPALPSGVDAVLVWRAGPAGQPGTMLLPPPSSRPNQAALLDDPCIAKARQHATATSRREDIAAAWLACTDRPTPIALLAASRAADQLLAAGHPDEAAAALREVDLPLDPPPDLVAALGVDIDAVVARQIQLAEALAASGKRDEAVGLLVAAGRRVLSLDAPALDRLLPLVRFPVIADLEELDAEEEASALERAAIPAGRRLAAWRVLRERVASGADFSGEPLLTVDVRHDGGSVAVPVVLLSDPEGQRRFLLAVARLPDGLRIALQLDPDTLLDDLLRGGPTQPLLVLDASGRALRPPGAEVDALLATVPFGRLLPELRLAMTGTAQTRERIRAWRRSQLLPVTVVLVMAAFAIVARVAADRQQRELWQRQQAFVSRVSHELKTPLAGIKVMAELIEMGVVSRPDEIVQSAQRIITETSRMENRVNEILKQARRPEIGEKTTLDIADMARALADEWTPRFEQRDARLIAQIDPTAPVLGDRELIRDAINNLLDNALKYLREDVAGVVRLRTGDAGRWVVIEVADNGLGVPEEMRRAIFERFTRVEGDGRGKAGGHGLGLAFVAEAVGEHGGKVECREGIGGGARFIIRLRRI